MGQAFVAFKIPSGQMNQISNSSLVDAASRLKSEALKLFAEHGIDGVSVRDIAQAAGQKNHGAVAYHFGSKDALVREVLLDGALLIDQKRIEILDAIEAEGGPHTYLDVVRALVYPAVEFAPVGTMTGYHRFFFLMDMIHRDSMMHTHTETPHFDCCSTVSNRRNFRTLS